MLLSVWESEVHACWARDPNDRQIWTSTSTMASIVAGLQVETAISAAENATEAFSLHIDLEQTPLARTIQHGRSPECPLHSETSGAPFPICTLAECSECSKQFSPNRRIAWMRRWGVCPSCGCRKVIIRDGSFDELVESAS